MQEGQHRRGPWPFILIGLIAGLVILNIGVPMALDTVLGGDVPDEPPSERASNTTSDHDTPSPTDERGRRSGFEQLNCTFTGSATIDPPLPMLPLFPGPHSMQLTPDSRFTCQRPGGTSAGSVSMDAKFAELSSRTGVGAGTGSIEWSQLPPEGGIPAEGGPGAVSSTFSEIELSYPQIVVWITITDGPYAGFRGRLVLEGWDREQNASGDIVKVEFARTEVSFSYE